jgi:hypothetical protein
LRGPIVDRSEITDTYGAPGSVSTSGTWMFTTPPNGDGDGSSNPGNITRASTGTLPCA